MEINKLSQRLLSEGYTEDQTPPGCRPWDRFYGGWTYTYRDRLNTVFETPCGLLLNRTEMGHSGTMWYMGINWTEENDNATIICPYYDRNTRCELNHPVLESVAGAGCHYESLHFCAVHETDRPYCYWCEMPNRRRRMIMSLDRPCVHWNDGYCQKFSDNEVQAWCVDGPCEYEQPSNADRIRAMSDEELRDFLQSRVWICETHKLCDTCPMYDEEKGCLSMLEWLKQPAEETNAPT